MSTTTATDTARALRIAEIRDGALVRARLGQGALHRIEAGLHVVTVGGVAYSGDTVDAAIAAMLGRQRDGGPTE